MNERDVELAMERVVGLLLDAMLVDAVNATVRYTNGEMREPVDAVKVAVATMSHLYANNQTKVAGSYWQAVMDA